MELSYFFVVVFQPRSYVAFTREEQELRRMLSSRLHVAVCLGSRAGLGIQFSQLSFHGTEEPMSASRIHYRAYIARVCVFCLITNARTLSSVYYSFRVEHNVHVDRVRCANRRPWLSLVCDGRRLPVVSPHTVLLPRALYAVSSYVFALQIAVALSRFF